MSIRAHCKERPASGLAARYDAVRGETERLAAPLSAEDQLVQSMPDASPTKWHRAHTTWFFETFLLKSDADYREFDSAYGYLFNSYYEAVGPRHPRTARGMLTRPTCAEIADYRGHVDDAMSRFIAARGEEPEFAALIELGLNHEQQHQELLLTDILHAHSRNPLKPAYAPFKPASPTALAAPKWLECDGGQVEIGHDGKGFAFDNEGPRHAVLLRPYRVSDSLVTNADWLEFMQAGGYRDPKYWLSDGWQRAREEDWSHPLYWESRDGEWFAMTLSGLQPLDLAAPVCHVSYYEADAFARFKGARLPTEYEWENAAAPSGIAGNFADARYLRPIANGGRMFGDVWQWTGSAYLPYPGFEISEGAVGEYNGKFMINQMVLRGGSCATPAGHIRASYRNFFYPHQRWQFMGLRLASDLPKRRPAPPPTDSVFLRDVWNGLARPQKAIPSKYFYDGKGSALFEEICALPEYYQTRTELALLRRLMPELAPAVARGTALVEFGCGASAKARILLAALAGISAYVPIDICGYTVDKTAAELRKDYPDVIVAPLAGDFMRPVELPEAVRALPRLGFFPGSTIGNLDEAEAIGFLKSARAILGAEGRLLIGIDLVKDIDTLIAAYDDSAGVTAAFNRNVLVRANRELEADFVLAAFAHRAIWNAERARIEMHLVSTREQTVKVAGRAFRLARGETIHTENAHKYTVEGFAAPAAAAGWQVEKHWVAEDPGFAVLLLR